MHHARLRLLGSLFVGVLLAGLFSVSGAQAQAPAPEDVFGFEPGADYKMADYDQVMTYYRQLSEASDRVQMRDIGTTVLGRSMPLLIISSAENLDNLDRWRDVSETLARARVEEEEARSLSEEGKAVVWIDAGLHATERVHAQMAPELAHRVTTEEVRSRAGHPLRDDRAAVALPPLRGPRQQPRLVHEQHAGDAGGDGHSL
jgi:hypothetical protein